MKIPDRFALGCIIIMLGAAVIVSTSFRALGSQVVEASAKAIKKFEGNQYFGVVTEIDRGEGVFALEWDGYVRSASEWAGMIAEFKRRHTDLDVLSHSIVASTHVRWGNGAVIITAPKNRCPR